MMTFLEQTLNTLIMASAMTALMAPMAYAAASNTQQVNLDDDNDTAYAQ